LLLGLCRFHFLGVIVQPFFGALACAAPALFWLFCANYFLGVFVQSFFGALACAAPALFVLTVFWTCLYSFFWCAGLRRARAFLVPRMRPHRPEAAVLCPL
jgi:hypothetical protein